MIRPGLPRIAFRVGGFGALGYVLSELFHGHAGDRLGLLRGAIEVWVVVALLWFVVEAVRVRR